MTPVQIGRKRFSEIFWNIVDERVDEYPYETIEKIVKQQQRLREEAEYNTGSVPYDDAVDLYKLVKFFQPVVIAEVGTFIGVSTVTMNLAMERLVDIYTCDMSNNINLDIPNIFQYPKTSSMDMFQDLIDKSVKADLVYLDGRLNSLDMEPLSKIMHEKTVVVFDDFEGTEKGVTNALFMERADRVLVYPRDGKKTAVSLPFTMLQFVPQESV